MADTTQTHERLKDALQKDNLSSPNPGDSRFAALLLGIPVGIVEGQNANNTWQCGAYTVTLNPNSTGDVLEVIVNDESAGNLDGNNRTIAYPGDRETKPFIVFHWSALSTFVHHVSLSDVNDSPQWTVGALDWIQVPDG